MSNSHNKQALINKLCDKLKDNDVRCKNATDDADLLIALTAVDCALFSEVVVIGEDTDILVLHVLIHHVNQQCKGLFLNLIKCLSTKNENMENTSLREDVCNLLPFLHSITGCDSTSTFLSRERTCIKKKNNQEYLKMQGQVIINNDSLKQISSKQEKKRSHVYFEVFPFEGIRNQHSSLQINYWKHTNIRFRAISKFQSVISVPKMDVRRS
ncbi:unnamed protein product [Mytilus edulis]|uniref:Uncharacterized protein n=1 Tax=Mytilus edulis TaxID=6550 RepID=A0A8S3U6D3_MYTED|nr:unnamed protein product [Mytilus edulis]